MAQHDDRCGALENVTRLDRAAQLRRDAGDVEDVAVREPAVVALGLPVARQVGRADVDGAQGLKLRLRFPHLLVIHGLHRLVVIAGLLSVDRDDRVNPLGIWVGRRLQHQRVRDAVHEDHGAEAEPQHAGRKCREGRRPRETRGRGLELVEECAHR